MDVDRADRASTRAHIGPSIRGGPPSGARTRGVGHRFDERRPGSAADAPLQLCWPRTRRGRVHRSRAVRDRGAPAPATSARTPRRCPAAPGVSRRCRAARGRGRTAGRAASSARGPTHLDPAHHVRRRRRRPAGRAAGAAAAAAGWPRPWTRPAAPARRRAAHRACSASATSGPTSSAQRPEHRAPVSRGYQPRSSDTRDTSRPNGCGSRSSGPDRTSGVGARAVRRAG